MSDEEEVDIVFDVNDKATPKLTRLEHAAERLDKVIGRASEKFSRFAEIAGGALGVFGGAESLRAAKEYIDHVDRISNLTGLAAENVAGISEALQIAGVESGEVEGMLTRMVKKSALLTEENKAQAKLAERYGIKLTQGPQKSLVAISALVEKNKIGAGQVGRILGIQGATLANMMDAMTKGPEALGKMINDATESSKFLGGGVLDETMQMYDESINRAHMAWKRLVATIITKVAPSVIKLADKLSAGIEGWSGKAVKFATYMIDHMTTLISMAKTYAKFMLINNLAERFTGRGLVGNVMRLGSNAGAGVFGGAGGGAVKMIRELFTGVVRIRPLLTIFARFALITGAIAVIYYLFKKIIESTEGAGFRIKQMFETIWNNLQAVGRQFMTMFSEDSTLGKFFRWLGEEGLLGIVEKIVSLFNDVIMGLRIVVTALSEHVGFSKARDIIISQTYKESGLDRMVKAGAVPSLSGEVPSGPTSAITQAMRQKFSDFDKARAMYESAGGPKMWSEAQLSAMRARYASPAKSSSSTPENTVYQDFRGSRFDVTQQFAEGFDPDRIAVGFANDIAALGERRLQSGFSPLFTVR